jgi:hypothetical protein
VTRQVSNREAGLRKRPHLVRHGRSSTHPFEQDEPPARSHRGHAKPHSGHRDWGVAHDLDVFLSQAERHKAFNLTWHPPKVHHRGVELRNMAEHGGHQKAPVRFKRQPRGW